jgi:hypothetical protein
MVSLAVAVNLYDAGLGLDLRKLKGMPRQGPAAGTAGPASGG